MTDLERIQELKRNLRSIEEFIMMRRNPDHHQSTAMVSAPVCSLTLCWQAYAGSKNYHSTDDYGLTSYMAKAAKQSVDDLLLKAKGIIENELAVARITRKAELQAELEAIEKLELEGCNAQPKEA